MSQSFPIVIVGHVDHGKSTLVGRLMHDTGSLPDGKVEKIRETCEKRGMPFEWAFVMDALKSERDQNITIDTSHIWFNHAGRNFVIIDAPGHREFLKNMVTGAAKAEAAVLVIDATEGAKEQSRRHGYLLSLLGIRQIIVAVNKMDAVNFDEKIFKAVVDDFSAYLKSIGITAAAFIPISARNGDNVVEKSVSTPWNNSGTIVDAIALFCTQTPPESAPLRLPVQDVYRFDERRIIAGRVESGAIKVGDEIIFSPSNKIARVRSIETFDEAKPNASFAGESTGITLEEQIFIERGEVISHLSKMPILSATIHTRIFWLGRDALVTGKKYKLRIATAEYSAELKEVTSVTDTENLTVIKKSSVERNEVAEVVFKIKGLAAIDDFQQLPSLGRFVVEDAYQIAGGGIIDTSNITDMRVTSIRQKSENIYPVEDAILPQQRAVRNGHRGGVIWLTGLSGSGKSTVALGLEQRLFAKGMQVYVLDGDNIRTGLSKDLGFSKEDRAENIRRVGEVAALFANAGMIVITAFISPYREDRRRARAAAPELFNTVYIKAPLEVCESRDPKGLYKKARTGQIPNFTGVSDIYEEPENPDLIIDTSLLSVYESIDLLEEFVQREFTI